MSKEREILGVWWLPDAPSNRWTGSLTMNSNQSPRLKFVLQNDRDAAIKIPLFPAVIFGHDEHRCPITLFNLGYRNTKSSSSFTEWDFSAGNALLGIELPKLEDFLVHSTTLYIQHLFEWVGRSGFSLNFEKDKINAPFISPEVLEFNVDENLSIKVSHSLLTHHGWSSAGGSEWSCREDERLEFYSKSGFTFSDTKKLIESIRKLLHFAILEPVYPTQILCQINEYGNTYVKQFVPQDIEICSGLNRDPIESEIVPNFWIFQFSDVQENFEIFFRKWLEFVEKYEEALNSYFTIIHQNLPVEIQLLCLTQALEAYHGIKEQSQHPKTKFTDRIRALGKAHKESMGDLIDDVDKFTETVQANRNYYTHHNPDWLSKGVIKGVKLLHLNEKLKLLFQMCILTEMGIPESRFDRLRRQLATHVVEY